MQCVTATRRFSHSYSHNSPRPQPHLSVTLRHTRATDSAPVNQTGQGGACFCVCDQQTKKAYRRLASSVKMRRRRYTIYTILALLAFALLVTGIVMSTMEDISSYGDQWSIGNVQFPTFSIPAIAACTVIIFIAISLIHLICKAHCWRKDRRFLRTPILTDPEAIYDN